MTPRPLSAQQYAAGDFFADLWLGAPFCWDGRDRATGTDCWGLVWLFHRDVLGRRIPDWRRGLNDLAWCKRTIAREALAQPNHFSDPSDGLIVTAMRPVGASHVGLVWRGAVLHAAHGRGVVRERLAEFRAVNPRAAFVEYAA
jgi:cell wall-associated NlpC family hydrolase